MPHLQGSAAPPPQAAPADRTVRRARRLAELARLGLERRVVLIEGLVAIPDDALAAELLAELELVAGLLTETASTMVEVAA